MCLPPDWFAGKEHRNHQRSRHGVSYEEAKGTLFMINTSADPVATEMAEWIEENWTPEQVARMDPAMRADYDAALACVRQFRAWLKARGQSPE